MSDHPGATLYRNYVERFLKGDIDSIAALLADDVVWHEPGGADAIVGKQPLLGQMRWVTSAINVEIELHDVVASDQHVVASSSGAWLPPIDHWYRARSRSGTSATSW